MQVDEIYDEQEPDCSDHCSNRFVLSLRRYSCPQLDAGEEAHLIFMREEEKLARDVYLTLGAMYPNNPIFMTIAERSERANGSR